MTLNLAGLHDYEGLAIAPPHTWLIDTIALSENPVPRAYPHSNEVIARLNHGYGSTGTLPLPDGYNAFAATVARHVAGTSGCHRWIIGNEPNLSREWPEGNPIFPWHYAACFKLCRNAIRGLAGHTADEVLIAAAGPWNDELKYEGNPNGDWIINFTDVIDLLSGQFDGFSLHAYTHGYNVNLVTSTARMNAPFQNRYYEFWTYRDYCNAIPDEYLHLPAYITEANGNGAWQAVGLMPTMLADVNGWNIGGNRPKIGCVAFYRYPKYDQFFIEGRDDVIAEYRHAVELDYSSLPIPSPIPEPTPEPTPEPSDDYIEDWDARLDLRGTKLIVCEGAQGQEVWHVTVGEWFDESQAQGRVSCYLKVYGLDGKLAVGVPVRWFWSSGEDVKKTEIKTDPWIGGQYSLDFPMYHPAPSYGFAIGDGAPSDAIEGLGLGSIAQPNYNIHTCYLFEVRRFVAAAPIPPIPPSTGHTEYVLPFAGANMRSAPVDGVVIAAIPYGAAVSVTGSQLGTDGFIWKHSFYLGAMGWIRGDLLALAKPVPPIPPRPAGFVVHPLPGGVITQHFYQNPDSYAQFGMAGHDGTDFGGKGWGTPFVAIADGTVADVGKDRDYGNFVRVAHKELGAYSFYAHAQEISVAMGDLVQAGQTIGLVGSTGNSTGPHLHLEIRLMDKDGSYSKVSPMKQGRCDPETWCALFGLGL